MYLVKFILLTSHFLALTAQAFPLLNPTFPRAVSSKVVNQTICNGQRYAYENLAGYGFVPSRARDKYGDTLGGYGSSIAIDGQTWKKSKDGSYSGILWAVPDRGWNTQGTLNYQNRIHKFSVSLTPATNGSSSGPSPPNFHLTYLDTILLVGPNGTPTTGLEADSQGGLVYGGFPILPAATYPGDGFGDSGPGGKRISIDSEGLVLAPDGSFWISDEYGPYIYHFSSNGRMLSAIQPPPAYLPRRNSSISFSSDTPPIYDPDRALIPSDTESGRDNNQGFEGLTVSSNGKTLYTLLQSALDQEGGPDNPDRKQSRLLEYDISNPRKPAFKAEYVVTLPLYTDPTSKKTPRKVAGQSEILSLGNGQFFVLARDSGFGRGQESTTSNYRHVDVFDISSATNIKSKENDGVNDSIASSSGVLNDGIKAAVYCSFLDFNVNSELGRFGLHNGGADDAGLLNEKWESLAVVPVDERQGADGEWFVISLSDNDFITQDGYQNGGNFKYKDESGLDIDNQALIFRVKLPKKAKPA